MKNSKGSKKTYVILDSDCDEYRYADSLQDIEDYIDNMSSNFADLKSFSEFVKENVRVFEIGRKINIKVASKKITVGWFLKWELDLWLSSIFVAKMAALFKMWLWPASSLEILRLMILRPMIARRFLLTKTLKGTIIMVRWSMTDALLWFLDYENWKTLDWTSYCG